MTRTKKLPVGQQDQGQEVVLHDQGEGYQEPKTFRSWSSQVVQGVNEIAQVLIGIIVFDELELIIFVGQGFTLSTASIVVLSVASEICLTTCCLLLKHFISRKVVALQILMCVCQRNVKVIVLQYYR